MPIAAEDRILQCHKCCKDFTPRNVRPTVYWQGRYWAVCLDCWLVIQANKPKKKLPRYIRIME